MNETKKPLISFCIPTFNRCVKTFELVTNILKYKDNDIEVVVLDNCSTDQTNKLLESVVDDRFRFISNSANIGGILNILKVLTLGKGEYSFLCLDKDFIHVSEIPNLISRIKEDKDVIFGYCSLNLNEGLSDTFNEKGYNSVLNMAYLGKHPSGNFYKTELYKASKVVRRLFEEESKFEFTFEIINAEFAMKGKSRIVNLSLFFTETKEDCSKVVSFTYNNSNLYFEPHKRFSEFLVYTKSLNNLNLTEIEKYKLTKLLYSKALYSATFLYKFILSDQSVCLHHGITTRKVSVIELININIKFSLLFFKENIVFINVFQKCIIWFFSHKVNVILILNKFNFTSIKNKLRVK